MKNNNINIFQSKNINDYKNILEGLIEDFGFIYYHAILSWCGIIENSTWKSNKYWQVYLVKIKIIKNGKIFLGTTRLVR